jgi:hypothetical protein
MQRFIKSRMHMGAWAAFIVMMILVLQNSLSDSISVGRLVNSGSALSFDEDLSNQIWEIMKLVVFLPVIVFWILDRKRLMWISIVVSNAILTFELLVSTVLLVLTLNADTAAQVYQLMNDTVLVMVINVLIFALWYWMIDSPLLRQGTHRESEPWDLLFPQRAGNIPGYDDWIPGFPDYLFVAFTASFAFGPTDTMPISQRSKAFMLMQAAISVVSIVVLAGRALSLPNLN